MEEESGLYNPIKAVFKSGQSGRREEILEPPQTSAKLQLGVAGGKRAERSGGLMSQIIGDGLTQRILNLNSQDAAQPEEERVIGEFMPWISEQFSWPFFSLGGPLELVTCGDLRVFHRSRQVPLAAGNRGRDGRSLQLHAHHLYIFDHCIVKPNGEVSIFSHDQQGSAKPPPSLEASGPVTLQGYAGSIGMECAGGSHIGQKVGSHPNQRHPEEEVPAPTGVFRPLVAAPRCLNANASGGSGSSGGQCAYHGEGDFDRRCIDGEMSQVGLELFFSDGLNCLLIFHKTQRDDVFDTVRT
eukprot:232323-Rhodomonas_salina.8